MSSLTITSDALSLSLTPAEKVLGLHGDVVVPLSAVVGVEVVPDGLAATHGLRAPGLALPGRRKLGTWRSRHRREFVDVRRGQPAVRITLRGQSLDALLVGTDDAEGLAAQLRARV